MNIKILKDKLLNKNKIGTNIIVMSLAISGFTSITAGAVLNKTSVKKVEYTAKVKVIEKQISKTKTDVPILKEIEVEVNNPISVVVDDYIKNLAEIEQNVLKKFKLDTSLVNVTAPGTYTYTISYKDKKYNGQVIVKEKELPGINNMTLKEISLEKGTSLPSNLSDYIVEEIPEEAKSSIKIDTSSVNINVASNYQYTVKYKDKLYTGKIVIYEPQAVVSQNQETNKDEDSSSKTDSKNEQNVTESSDDDTTTVTDNTTNSAE